MTRILLLEPTALAAPPLPPHCAAPPGPLPPTHAYNVEPPVTGTFAVTLAPAPPVAPATPPPPPPAPTTTTCTVTQVVGTAHVDAAEVLTVVNVVDAGGTVGVGVAVAGEGVNVPVGVGLPEVKQESVTEPTAPAAVAAPPAAPTAPDTSVALGAT